MKYSLVSLRSKIGFKRAINPGASHTWAGRLYKPIKQTADFYGPTTRAWEMFLDILKSDVTVSK